MGSTFPFSPAAQEVGARRFKTPGFPARRLSVSVPDASAVSLDSAPASPVNGQLRTPLSGSNMGLRCYQPSEYGGDPFFGAQSTHARPGSPSFLDEHLATKLAQSADGPSYPPTPARTESISVHNVSPRSPSRCAVAQLTDCSLPDSVSPEQLQTSVRSFQAVDPAELTSKGIVDDAAGDGGMVPAPLRVGPRSPRVAVSVWDHGGQAGDVAAAHRPAGNCGVLVPGEYIAPVTNSGFVIGIQDPKVSLQDDVEAPRVGLDPESRPADEVPSIKEVAARRELDERNQEVSDWLAQYLNDPSLSSASSFSPPEETSAQAIHELEQSRPEHEDGIPLGDQTENRIIAGQTYYNEAGGGFLSQVDRDIIAVDAKWDDAPMLPHIIAGSSGISQPQTSQAAIEKYEGLCRDNDSILSRSATWGTRRRSSPSVLDLDIDNSQSGSFLKKLAARGREKTKKGSLFKDLRGLVNRPSATSVRKRSRSRSRGSAADGDMSPPPPPPPPPPAGEQQTSPARLSPRSPTWRRRRQKPTPSINTALASVAYRIVNIGTPLSQSASFCITPPLRSPRTSRSSTFGMRSSHRSGGPQLTPARVDSHNSFADLWKRSAGPLMTPLSKTSHFGGSVGVDDDDDDDDDDDELLYEVGRMTNSSFMDSMTPSYEGFQQHILAFYPQLGEHHGYLVDRIAHQQVVRYKNLLSATVKHLNYGTSCPNGSLCAALGGSSGVSGTGAGVEGGGPADGVIGPDSFPPDIPLPPTARLPAEFECQLCFQRKRFQKPSDWTKHVHEDIQPFTCTWDKCRDPKVFKRKADWVRHENEGHRHLEWWTCDVDDCQHTCYRRDNFLQHLVREHKFPEPKVKTKAAMKRSGGLDSTWQAVEKCHVETSARPQDEPCRFCGKLLPTWKKLTVHLAKHMEHISLAVLRLAAARSQDLTADDVISPVLDPGSRPASVFCGSSCNSMATHQSQLQPSFASGGGYPSDQKSSFGYRFMEQVEGGPQTPSSPLFTPHLNQGYAAAASTMPSLLGSPPALYMSSTLGESQMSCEPVTAPPSACKTGVSMSGWEAPAQAATGFSGDGRLTSPSIPRAHYEGGSETKRGWGYL
ncbi:hypothetical protein CDD80_6183 [Ophiocordyceps camponoti-rufipedis]|uniref:C2H2-type domain-containing protein n=1 Tax=Ophiocordyceps camponoti-rufipedis TaxID=2004952 RepID=A0A2C5YR15_9HYPO|nr:hypothetical protein CDD80_6183 [Ophiocordyceps camponoti-rufipedis]